MSRFYLPPEEWGDAAALAGDEAKHLGQVLRVKAGEMVTVFDGEGRRAEAEVLAVTKRRVDLRVGEVILSPVPRPGITLAQAVPKGKNMEWIIQKAVELGVARVQPLVTRHTIVSPGDQKGDKWRRVALEAAKQCGQDRVPVIGECAGFRDWLGGLEGGGVRVIASLREGSGNFREVLRGRECVEEVTILVGPEGDFSKEEYGGAVAAGFSPVTLGELVLRVETAALVCVAGVRYEYG